jgi:putative hydrolase of the HAD superfamily
MPSAEPIRAVLFDVDGTLYHQTPVRALMAAELALRIASDVRTGSRIARVLRTFRRVREELRALGCPAAPLEELQFARAAERLGETPAFVRKTVEEWMFRRPVGYIRWSRRSAVASLVGRLRRRRVTLGVLSDYPADAKLHSLGLDNVFSIVACTSDSAINAFKPHPRGFLHACAVLGVAPAETAYVGDRADVDAAGAHAAGMRCYLVGRQVGRNNNTKEGGDGCRRFQDLERICVSAA